MLTSWWEGAVEPLHINEGASVLEGWLQKRVPSEKGYAWKPVWCILMPKVLICYEDERRLEKRGEIRIKAGACASRYSAPDAPKEACDYCKQRPYGFFVDVNPSASSIVRHIHFFDAETEENQHAWIEALSRAAKQEALEATGFLQTVQSPSHQRVRRVEPSNPKQESDVQSAIRRYEAQESESFRASLLKFECKEEEEVSALRKLVRSNSGPAMEEAPVHLSGLEQFIVQDAEELSARACAAEVAAQKQAQVATAKADAAEQLVSNLRVELCDALSRIDSLATSREAFHDQVKPAYDELKFRQQQTEQHSIEQSKELAALHEELRIKNSQVESLLKMRTQMQDQLEEYCAKEERATANFLAAEEHRQSQTFESALLRNELQAAFEEMSSRHADAHRVTHEESVALRKNTQEGANGSTAFEKAPLVEQEDFFC